MKRPFDGKDGVARVGLLGQRTGSETTAEATTRTLLILDQGGMARTSLLWLVYCWGGGVCASDQDRESMKKEEKQSCGSSWELERQSGSSGSENDRRNCRKAGQS